MAQHEVQVGSKKSGFTLVVDDAPVPSRGASQETRARWAVGYVRRIRKGETLSVKLLDQAIKWIDEVVCEAFGRQPGCRTCAEVRVKDAANGATTKARAKATKAKAVKALTKELGVEVHDPPPPRTRKRTRVASSSTRVEDGSTAATRRSVRATGATGTEDLTKAQAAILRAAVQRHPRSSTDAQLAVLGGYSVTSSSFSNAVSALRCAGYLSGAPTSRLATKDGVERADHVEKMPRGPALVAFWQGKIQKAEAVILGTIVDMTRNTAGDAPLDKQVIADESRYSIASSSFSNALSKLRTLRLIDRATHRCVEELRR